MFAYVLIFLVLTVTTPIISLAWGPIGHMAVAQLAQDLIQPSTQLAINKIIPDGNLSAIANWADHVRTLPEFRWSGSLHFINTPAWNCSYIRDRDCFANIYDPSTFLMCVDGAIQNYTSRLLNMMDTFQDDLKFLVHFVGDIHQPLHCGFSSDRGGNDIFVHFLGHYKDLHGIWDSGLIELNLANNFNNNWLQWVWYLEQNYVQPFVLKCDMITGECSESWGQESVSLACTHAYVLPDGSKIENGTILTTEYINYNIEMINIQITKAAIRLGAVLDFLFSNDKIIVEL